ncbi:transglycosylase SLT domain-containing protein [Thioalkalivibrio sp. XN8]|uniref:transglycosylase SLT domain-containing protein n=1 Tax=Thioalkalivibrio sp. XN8 TaxID=2712863 RepID=UPI0013ED7B12|nr:transglycosylase SLT domain-containing protein [Thioalkalivibrio sp. XN8]NGP52791.1 transglycosylase SLT domain-containing protein [Thioalkalivibrio sp. XN8]
MPLRPLLIFLVLLAAGQPAGAALDAEARLEAQREVFRRALPLAEAGRWGEVEPLLGDLQGYVLLPDLRAAWLRTRLGRIDDAEVGAFLAAHEGLGFAPGLRRQWARSLASRQRWAEYLALYEAHFARADDTVLACHAFSARLALGRLDGLAAAVRQRWLAPASQPEACDPAFAWLQREGGIDPATRRARVQLALEAGEFRLARWLARPLGDSELAAIARRQEMHEDPLGRLVRPASWHDTPEGRELLHYGFRRLAATHPEIAAGRWPYFRDRFSFSTAARAEIEQRIALIHAWRHLPGAAGLLDALPAAAQDEDTRAWRARIALRAQDWAALERALDAMPAAEAQEPTWRYWRARLLESTGRSDEARAVYATLSGERGYYSFLAADHLNAPYAWQDAPTAPRDDVLAALAQRPDVRRSRELFLVGLESYGRGEWQDVLTQLDPAARAQAGILASRWGWHSRAITAATVAGANDDLGLRFPLAWQPAFEQYSGQAGIDTAWALGVARSESLFIPDARSVAGALGLMQLMPATGRQLAREAGLPWGGAAMLVDPETNIALGITYLAQMLGRFGDHRVLATAAYNAGPTRVDRWLPEQGALPADAWVDSMPYRETRNYVQRVLASEAVFRWRLSGETARLTDAMPPVPARAVP